MIARLSVTLVLLAACSSEAPSNGPRAGGAAPSAIDVPGATAEAGSFAALPEGVRAALSALSPASLPAPPADPTNRFADDASAAALGKKLFSETRFSGPLLDGDNDGSPSALGQKGDVGKVSCASCHVESAGFSDNRSFQKQISLGAGWGRRRTPSLLDVGQAKLLMWDGKSDALFNQVFGPIESVVEMNGSRLFTAQQMYALYKDEYEALFGPMPPLGDTARFPALTAANAGCVPSTVDPVPECNGPFRGRPGDGAEYDGLSRADQDAVTRVVVNMGKAIGAFERTLACGQGRFDAWVRGDNAALEDAEKRGAALFVGKGSCASCHSGPFMSDQKFHNVGLMPTLVQAAFIDSADRGAATGLAQAIASPLNSRGAYSDDSDDRLPNEVPASAEAAFRTPMLRCVSQRPTFMHTGQLGRLENVVAFFDRGGDKKGYTGTNELKALGLTPGERDDLVAFLRALDGKAATK